MNIMIYGAGAMGLYFAATLAQAGHDIHLKARSPWPLATGSQPEITVQRADGSQESVSIASVFTDVTEQLDVDAVLIATKAWQVPGALEELDGKIPSSALLLTVQNGITAPEHCARTLPKNPTLASTCVVIVERKSPQTVHLLGREAQLTVGEFQAGNSSDGLSRVQDMFERTPVEITPTSDIQRALWKKLALIASYGGVGAVSQLTVGQTRSHDSTRNLVLEAIQETARVARAHGLTFTEQDVQDTFAIYTDVFAPGTTSSMQRDLAEGRPSELDDQVGEIVRRAEASGVDAPVQNFLHRVLRAREEIARDQEGS
ncbi:ketopantoate reductase family protein [Rothia sp. P4278]|uniref:ketopantoate reductase family protein n=1 Tax=Rothia sp. P4278 TaxID=3402658 RepID=UPI003AE4A18D